MALLVVALATSVLAAPSAGASSTAARVKRPRVAAAWPADAVPGSLLVTTVDGGLRLLEVPPGQEVVHAARLLAQPDVAAVEPDRVRQLLRTSSDPRYGEQWAHQTTRVEEAWDFTTGDAAVRVAVLDSGVDGTHPAIRANLVRQIDISSGSPVEVPLGTDNDRCDQGHGTFVAGVVGAPGDDGQDLAGVAWRVGIVDIALSGLPRCQLADSAIVAGIRHATSLGVDVINLSLGGPGDTCPTAYQRAIDEARANGVVVVAAAGNYEQVSPGVPMVPASCNGVISVGAVGEDRAPASYSSTNRHVDLAAPGGDSRRGRVVLGLREGGGTRAEEGTSFAAPYVAGAVALLRSIDRTISPDAVESALERTTGAGGRSTALGWGVVDVGAAVRRVRDGGVLPPEPDPPFPIGLVVRMSAQQGTTSAVRQAVAVSRFVFEEDRAQHAVLARADDFADGLAGSSLGFGVGPVLFADRVGTLNGTTAEELQRTLPAGATVYVLGGTSALPSTLEGDLTALGFVPKRLAGATRQATAAVVADEVVRRVEELGFGRPDRVLLATAFSWPDAVTAGSLGAWFGEPILLTDARSLSPETADALGRLRPVGIAAIGGTAAISDAVVEAAGHASGAAVTRLAGATRSDTALAVARSLVTDFRTHLGFDPQFAVLVNLRRGDGFAHALSASAVAGAHSGIFLPVEGDGGTSVPDAVRSVACDLQVPFAVAAGDVDLISDGVKEAVSAMLEHEPAACRG